MSIILKALTFLLIGLFLSGCIGSVAEVVKPGAAMLGGDGSDDKEESSAGMDDETRTKVEGVALGAAAGALIGNLAGKDTESTLIGAAVGAGAGYVLGNEVAKRKKAYKNTEEMIEKESAHTAKYITQVRAVNTGLKRDIASYQKKIRGLQKKIKQGKSTSKALSKEKSAVDKKYADAQKALKGVENELATSEALYEDAVKSSAGKNSADLKKWEKRISELKKEKRRLAQHTDQLQAISSSIAAG